MPTGRSPFVKGLELDLAISHRGRRRRRPTICVHVPAKWRWDVGTHYHFKLAKRDATLRLQVVNVTGNTGWGIAGSGVYTSLPGRSLQGYLAVDF